jgi:hypothetical protein
VFNINSIDNMSNMTVFDRADSGINTLHRPFNELPHGVGTTFIMMLHGQVNSHEAQNMGVIKQNVCRVRCGPNKNVESVQAGFENINELDSELRQTDCTSNSGMSKYEAKVESFTKMRADASP